MVQFRFVLKILGLFSLILISGLMLTADVPGQSAYEPRLNHSACVYHCMMDQNFIHSEMGDTAAANSYYAFMQRFWETSGCDGVDVFDILDVLVSVSGAPSGATMSCYQLLLAQTKQCATTCENATPSNNRYGANVLLTASSQSPGYLAVTLSNRLGKDAYLEYANAYSGRFYLTTTLQLNEGTPLGVGHQFMPSMSFPNWITRGGSFNCNLHDIGSECPSCCRILMDLSTADFIPTSVEFMDGVLYDLTDQVTNKTGVKGSFSQNGFVVLESDNDRLTINQGPYAGITWSKIHNKSTGRHYETVNTWDASAGSVTIKNSECNWIGCRVTGHQTDVDTYVFALLGPIEKRLTGTYTVQSVANIYHDKDFSNNRISYSYTDLDIGDWQEPSGGDNDASNPMIDISTLPITVIPGEGVFNYTLPDDAVGMMFRLDVPQDVYSGTIAIVPQSGTNASAYGNWGSIPVPDYPHAWSYDYVCSISSTSDYIDRCQLGPGTFYLFVEGKWTSSKSFSIEVEFLTHVAATATASYRQTKQAEYAQTQQALIRTFTEVEPNDTRDTANEWITIEPFTGELFVGDQDYIEVTFDEAGIYTFGITEIAPQMRVTLGLLYDRGAGFLETVTSKNIGEGVSLTLDASAGERFYFKVMAYRYDDDGSYYTLELLDFIPDPHEPNDEKADATFWDITQGPIEGYFWEKSHISLERADYFRFSAPVTADGSAISFQVTNPSANISICMSLKNQNGNTIYSPPCSEIGGDASLVYTLVPEQDYYIKLSTMNNKTSFTPYSLRATYIGDGVGTGLSEVEPNNSWETANSWNMQDPFKGVLSTSSDKDYIRIEIPTPGIYTFSITDVSPNLKIGLYLLRAPVGGVIHQASANSKGQGVQLTMDGSAGEHYYLVVYASQWASDGSLYQLSLTGFTPDPGEPNDQRTEATNWEIDEGPVQGYFWEKTHVSRDRADYVQFTAPFTEEGGMVSFQVSNPGSDISICMNLLNHSGSTLLSGQCAPQGEDASLTTALVAGMDYYLKLYTVNNKVSLQPYTLSVDFVPGSEQDQEDTGRLVRLNGFVHRQWGLLPLPMSNVPIYVHISGQPAFLLDTTNWLGVYSTKVMLADGQQVSIWPVLEGTNFVPDTDSVLVEAGLRQHRSVFTVIGGQLEQQTPTPHAEPTDTPQPPFSGDTETPSPTALQRRETEPITMTPLLTLTLTSTIKPSSTETPIPPTELPPSEETSTTIIGMVWRLFENSEPAGIAAAEVTLSINGVDQLTVMSKIDGLYLMEVDGIQPGDILRLRVKASQDEFEPLYYVWQAEAGVDRWEYDFYSYWDEITPPSSMDQNRIWGTVWDQFEGDVSGLYLNLQMGTSDAIQRIGPTDEDGYFEAMVTLPDRIMVTVWVDAPGYVPSKRMFFHPYAPEDRELIFWKYYGEITQ